MRSGILRDATNPLGSSTAAAAGPSYTYISRTGEDEYRAPSPSHVRRLGLERVPLPDRAREPRPSSDPRPGLNAEAQPFIPNIDPARWRPLNPRRSESPPSSGSRAWLEEMLGQQVDDVAPAPTRRWRYMGMSDSDSDGEPLDQSWRPAFTVGTAEYNAAEPNSYTSRRRRATMMYHNADGAVEEDEDDMERERPRQRRRYADALAHDIAADATASQLPRIGARDTRRDGVVFDIDGDVPREGEGMFRGIDLDLGSVDGDIPAAAPSSAAGVLGVDDRSRRRDAAARPTVPIQSALQAQQHADPALGGPPYNAIDLTSLDLDTPIWTTDAMGAFNAYNLSGADHARRSETVEDLAGLDPDPFADLRRQRAVAERHELFGFDSGGFDDPYHTDLGDQPHRVGGMDDPIYAADLDFVYPPFHATGGRDPLPFDADEDDAFPYGGTELQAEGADGASDWTDDRGFYTTSQLGTRATRTGEAGPSAVGGDRAEQTADVGQASDGTRLTDRY